MTVPDHEARYLAESIRNVDAGLNSKALTILNCIWAGRNRSCPPTYREMMKVTGLAPHAVDDHVKRLVKLGLIKVVGKAKGARNLVPTCRLYPETP